MVVHRDLPYELDAWCLRAPDSRTQGTKKAMVAIELEFSLYTDRFLARILQVSAILFEILIQHTNCYECLSMCEAFALFFFLFLGDGSRSSGSMVSDASAEQTSFDLWLCDATV